MIKSEISSEEKKKSSSSGGGTKPSSMIHKFDRDELDTIERHSMERLENYQIFKSNPKFYSRLKLVTENESFYEAQQMYKTINFRWVFSPKTENNTKNAAKVIIIIIIFAKFLLKMQHAKSCGRESFDTFQRNRLFFAQKLGKLDFVLPITLNSHYNWILF